MMKRFSFFFFLICLAYTGTAVPYLGLRQWFRQPDGKQVELLLFGDEFYMRAETVDGFTVTREPESKWICYARPSVDGRQLVSTGIRVTEIPLSESQIRRFDLKSHLDISAEGRKEVVKENALRLAGGNKASLELPGHPHVHGTPVVPVSGNLMGLTLLVDFPDQPSTLPVSEFEAFCNQLDYNNFSNNGSLRTYFRDVSAGKLDLVARLAPEELSAEGGGGGDDLFSLQHRLTCDPHWWGCEIT